MRYVLLVGVWELVRPLLRRGLTLALRKFWAHEQRRELKGRLGRGLTLPARYGRSLVARSPIASLMSINACPIARIISASGGLVRLLSAVP